MDIQQVESCEFKVDDYEFAVHRDHFIQIARENILGDLQS